MVELDEDLKDYYGHLPQKEFTILVNKLLREYVNAQTNFLEPRVQGPTLEEIRDALKEVLETTNITTATVVQSALPEEPVVNIPSSEGYTFSFVKEEGDEDDDEEADDLADFFASISK